MPASISLPDYLALLPAEAECWQDSAQLWLFQSPVPIAQSLRAELDLGLGAFLQTWDSHGQLLHAYSSWFFEQILLISSPYQEASGCAMDRLFRYMRGVDEQYGLGFFRREWLLVWDDMRPRAHLVSELEQVAEQYFFDNSIHQWGEFRRAWIKPVAGSYLRCGL